MRTFKSKFCTSIFSSFIFFTGHLLAGDLEDFIELKKATYKEIAELKAIGMGLQHPQIIAKENQIIEIENKISTMKESHEDMIIFLKGTLSTHMKGHPKAGKSENALPTLLLQGWKIKTIIPAGDEKAYIWLTRE